MSSLHDRTCHRRQWCRPSSKTGFLNSCTRQRPAIHRAEGRNHRFGISHHNRLAEVSGHPGRELDGTTAVRGGRVPCSATIRQVKTKQKMVHKLHQHYTVPLGSVPPAMTHGGVHGEAGLRQRAAWPIRPSGPIFPVPAQGCTRFSHLRAHCDRGPHRYCSANNAPASPTPATRGAHNRRHQQSPEGQLPMTSRSSAEQYRCRPWSRTIARDGSVKVPFRHISRHFHWIVGGLMH